jgi:N-acetyl-gamma-glutamyl-phosphate reductase
MGARVAVAGGSGYAGGELLRLIAGHPDLELAAVSADRNAGALIAEVHPQLAGLPGLGGRRFGATPAGPELDCDLAFLALPAGQSAPLARQFPAGLKVVDLGPDYRLADPAAWARHYPGEHAGQWACGLPELPGARAAIRAGNRIAVPGCYATASILALVPLLAAGLIAGTDIVIVAASGTSGAGRVLRAGLLGSEVMGSVAAYQAGGTHRHTPEIEQALAAAWPRGGTSAPARAASPAPGPVPEPAGQVSVSFTPILAPMPRGILATCTARLAGAGADTATLRAALARAYAGEPFSCVLPEGCYPATGAVAGSNAVHLQAAADPRSGRATVLAALDNLGKGAAGQAVQCANLMLGLPETAGLTAAGIAP